MSSSHGAYVALEIKISLAIYIGVQNLKNKNIILDIKFEQNLVKNIFILPCTCFTIIYLFTLNVFKH